MVVRAVGPSLADFGVANALQAPTLELHSADGTLIAFNANWMESPDKQTIMDKNLAPTREKEYYTAIVRGLNNTTGVGLVEVFHLP